MDLALLRTFVAVHRAGSFTRAAELLGLSQPAVTSQIRTLERQLGRPLFHRRARGVTPTPVGDELAHKAAPHLDALLRITETEREAAGAPRTLHIAGPPEFLSLRVLPALAPLVGQGHTLRTVLRAGSEELLDALAAGHHDLIATTARPRRALFTAAALCDEEHVLVAAPYWAALVDPDRLRESGPSALDGIPLVEVHESLPLVTRYWAAVFDTRPDAATVVAPRPARGTGMRPGRRRARRTAPLPVPGRARARRGRRPAGAGRTAAAHLVPRRPRRKPRPLPRLPRSRPATARRRALVSPPVVRPGAFQKRSPGPLFSHDRTSRGQTHRPRDPARR
ncbi:hypothetical protein GCM10020254_44190 [Streptomyces goshikiensis]